MDVPSVASPLDVGRKAKAAHLWDRHPEDWYVEPRETSAMLFRAEKFRGGIYDPACGLGRIVLEARAAGYESWGTDLVRRWDGCLQEADFLTDGPDGTDNIVTNPPFRFCAGKSDFAFVRRCLDVARNKAALLLPADWHCSQKAAAFLRTAPLYRVWTVTPRPSMPPGPVVEAGIRPGNGIKDYAFYVFWLGYEGPVTLGWLTKDLLTKRENANG